MVNLGIWLFSSKTSLETMLGFLSVLEKGMLNASFSFIEALQLFPPSVGGSECFIRDLKIVLCPLHCLKV